MRRGRCSGRRCAWRTTAHEAPCDQLAGGSVAGRLKQTSCLTRIRTMPPGIRRPSRSSAQKGRRQRPAQCLTVRNGATPLRSIGRVPATPMANHGIRHYSAVRSEFEALFLTLYSTGRMTSLPFWWLVLDQITDARFCSAPCTKLRYGFGQDVGVAEARPGTNCRLSIRHFRCRLENKATPFAPRHAIAQGRRL